jgi:hypothetical protein
MSRIEAQRKYMTLSGAQRLALMCYLDVQKESSGIAYEKCITYIMGDIANDKI